MPKWQEIVGKNIEEYKLRRKGITKKMNYEGNERDMFKTRADKVRLDEDWANLNCMRIQTIQEIGKEIIDLKQNTNQGKTILLLDRNGLSSYYRGLKEGFVNSYEEFLYEEALENSYLNVVSDYMIFLSVDQAELIKRNEKRGNEEKVKEVSNEEYFKIFTEVYDHPPEDFGKFIKVDGNGTIDEVKQKIITEVEKILEENF